MSVVLRVAPTDGMVDEAQQLIARHDVAVSVGLQRETFFLQPSLKNLLSDITRISEGEQRECQF